MLSGIGKYVMVKLEIKNVGLEDVVVELLCWLSSYPDGQMCLVAIDLYYGISAEAGRKEYF